MAAENFFTFRGMKVIVYKQSFAIEGMKSVVWSGNLDKESIEGLISTIYNNLKKQAEEEVKRQLTLQFSNLLDTLNEQNYS